MGLLIWDGEGEALRVQSRQPGSRLKTPGLPIWITCCMGHFGIIFNSNRELLRNYHAEKRFELYHYTCASCFLSMTIDNRGQEDQAAPQIQRQNSKDAGKEGGGGGGDMVATPLEKLIHTKWMEAKVSIHGAVPANLTN